MTILRMPNEMTGFAIKRQDSVQPLYYSCKVARNFASPVGWSEKPEEALKFASQADAEDFSLSFVPQALMQTIVVQL